MKCTVSPGELRFSVPRRFAQNDTFWFAVYSSIGIEQVISAPVDCLGEKRENVSGSPAPALTKELMDE